MNRIHEKCKHLLKVALFMFENRVSVAMCTKQNDEKVYSWGGKDSNFNWKTKTVDP